MGHAACGGVARSDRADLIDKPELGRLAEGCVADIIAVPGDPLSDITVTRDVNFVMKGGKVFKNDCAN